MSFNFNNYEAYGKALQEGPDEVHYRSSVSRGYYSLFHKVKILLGYTENQNVTHKELIDELKTNSTLKRGAKLSHEMLNFKKDREDADYYSQPRERHRNFSNDIFCKQFWLRYDNYIKLLSQEKSKDNK